jgi:transcriptional regulator of acetoin/glycerol metabolism
LGERIEGLEQVGWLKVVRLRFSCTLNGEQELEEVLHKKPFTKITTRVGGKSFVTLDYSTFSKEILESELFS